MPFLIAGNWKMHGLGENLGEIRKVAKYACSFADANDVLICVPSTLVTRAVAVSAGNIVIGGEDCAADSAGAFTGDISADMLKDAGAGAVIVGHSERRRNHKETDAIVAAKAAAASRARLAVIICIGESQAERDAGVALQVCAAQLDASLPADRRLFTGSAIAYEPLWAIGTGQTPEPDDIALVHRHIRQRLQALMGSDAHTIRILYGGSITPVNAPKILALPEVGGALVGGASLRSRDFNAIIAAAAMVVSRKSKMNISPVPQDSPGGHIMIPAQIAPNKALAFATSWIGRNIEIGPFSWDDLPIYDGPISVFRKDAALAGLNEADLEHGLGPVPAFITKAYADAVISWQAAQKKHNTMSRDVS